MPTPSRPLDEPLLTGSSRPDASAPKPPGPAAPGMGVDPKAPAPESYADRLLKAKQKVWDERDKDKGKP